jgi:Fe-S-cluster containining protein
MGEAKRRHATALQYRDLITGEPYAAKDGGDVEAYLDRWGRNERPPVPCNGCPTCCYHQHVDVYPDQERPEDLPHMSIEKDEAGRSWLRKRPDGACIHLGDGGCAIYEHRPQSCRKYDCRIYSLFGVLDGMDGDRYTPAWAFRQETLRSRILLTAHKLAGMLAAAELKREGKPLAADAVAMRAFTKVHAFVQAMEEMNQVPREKWLEKFGIDPATMTKETELQAQRAMVTALGLADLPRAGGKND